MAIMMLSSFWLKFYDFYKEISYTDSIYRVYKDKLQNCLSKESE